MNVFGFAACRLNISNGSFDTGFNGTGTMLTNPGPLKGEFASAIVLKPGVRYIATLDLTKVRPGLHEADVREWLLKAGFTPTIKPNVWKADEVFLARLPAGSLLKAEKF